MSPPRQGAFALTAARACATGCAVAAALGLLGGVHPAFDSLGHFRAHLAVLAILAGASAFLVWTVRYWRGRAGLREADGVAAALAGVLILWPILPYLTALPPTAPAFEGERRYTLLQMNLRFDAAPEEALRRIAETRPDILTVQEVEGRWRERLQRLDATFPFQAYCREGYAVGDTAILSRHPLVEGTAVCSPRNGFGAQAVDLDGTPVTIVSQHLNWPWPSRQWGQIRNLDPLLRSLPWPVLLGGDFNAAPWSAAVRSYAGDGDLEIAAGIGPTWLHRWFPAGWIGAVGLPIDNILHSREIDILAIDRLAPTASDHLPLLVTFQLAAPRP